MKDKFNNLLLRFTEKILNFVADETIELLTESLHVVKSEEIEFNGTVIDAEAVVRHHVKQPLVLPCKPKLDPTIAAIMLSKASHVTACTLS